MFWLLVRNAGIGELPAQAFCRKPNGEDLPELLRSKSTKAPEFFGCAMEQV